MFFLFIFLELVIYSCPETPTVTTRISTEPMDPNQETPSERFSRKIQHSSKPCSRRLSPPPPRSPAVTEPRPSLHPAAAIPLIPVYVKLSQTPDYISPADHLKLNSKIYSLILITAPASQQTPQLQKIKHSPYTFPFLP